MDSKVAQGRLKVIHSHFITADDSPSLLGPNPTAGEFVSGMDSLFLSIGYIDICIDTGNSIAYALVFDLLMGVPSYID